MTSQVYADVQKLEPGEEIHLFELDATSITGGGSGDILRFHGYTEISTITWQGKEYTGWPIQAQGFERTTDQQPVPTLSVGNVDGSITALCLSYQDLLGAKLTRHRTFGKYLDAVNFDGAAVDADGVTFGTGDGATNTFQLANSDGDAVKRNIHIESIHQTDWQGRVALSDQPRTNWMLDSQNLMTDNWHTANGGTVDNTAYTIGGTSIPYFSISSPGTNAYLYGYMDPSANDVQAGDEFIAIFAVRAGSLSDVRPSIYAYQDSPQTGANNSSTAKILTGPGALSQNTGSNWYLSGLSQTEDTVVAVTRKVANSGQRTDVRPLILPGPPGNSQSGDILCTAIMMCKNITGGYLAYIPTTDAPRTVTDYTHDGAGGITTGQVPADGATLDWTGTGSLVGTNAQADPDAEFNPDVWFLERKSQETKEVVTWELSNAINFQGQKLPARQIIANNCPWKYRSTECGYTGGPVADINDNVTSDPERDACGKRLASCKLRFGEHGELSFGGYPAADLTRL